jgi:VWFA-related protein
MKGRLFRLAVASAAPLQALVAGSAPQVPMAGVEVEVVRLDVLVSDASGAPVPSLSREDFQVLEDGKPQRIVEFLLAGRRRTAASDTSSEARGPAPVDDVRHIVIVIDDLHMARETIEPAKSALQTFLAEQVAPDDKVALVATSSSAGLHALTQDRAALRQAISRISWRDTGAAESGRLQVTPAQAELILRGDQSALRLAARLVMDEPGSILTSDSPRATVEARDGATPAGLDPQEKAAAREAEREARTVLAGALRYSQTTLATVDAVLRGLASLPGRKLCLLVSDGFLVGRGTSEEQTQALRQVADAGTRSGAVVYALDARGLAPAGADASVVGPAMDPGLRERVAKLTRDESRATLRRLAEDTGGLLVTDAGDGLARMLSDNESYYLVAYEPTNSKHDGRFRKIELRLQGHPELVVRTRRGYLAPDDRERTRSTKLAATDLPSLVATRPTLTEPAVRAALSAPIPANGIPVQLVADYLDLPPDGPQAIVLARVEVTRLRWRETSEGRHRTEMEILGGFYDATGNPMGVPFGRSFELDLGDAEFRRAAEEGLRYAQRMPVSPGRYEVRVVAREPGKEPLGGVTQAFEVPDLAERTLTLSSLFVSAAAGAEPGAGQGDEALHEAQLLRRFKRSGSLYFQLYVYNALVDESGATDVVLQAQIRAGAELIAASKPLPVAFQRKDGLPLPESNGMSLRDLTPGRYELRVVVVDRKADATAHRSVDFTVE